MSANLDLARSIYADWERGDFSDAEWADPEIEYVIADGPAPGSWKGVAGMAEAMRDFFSAWEGGAARLTSTASLTEHGCSSWSGTKGVAS
jgi:hypothetical protein